MRKIGLLIMSIVLVLMTSIAFSAFSETLSITSEVQFRVLADIRVNSVALESANDATIAYDSEHSKSTVSNGFVLPSSGSSISYRVHIDNTGDVDYSIYDIVRTTGAQGLTATISGYTMRDVIPARTSVELVITYTTSSPSQNIINVVEAFNFKRVYYVTYETGTNETIAAQTKYEGVNLTLTSQEPSKTGYTFQRWNTAVDGTGVNYNSGATYTLDEDVVMYARYTLNTYNITYNLKNGTNHQNNPSTYTIETNDITLGDATKTLVFKGHYNETAGANAGSSSGVTIGSDTTQAQTFTGWTGNGTNSATRNLVLAQGSYGDKEYTAHFSAVAGTLPRVERVGYDCGWNTSNSGTTKEYLSEGTYPTSAITETMNTEINLYAVCEQTSFTVVYNTTENGGTGTIPNALVAFGDSIPLPTTGASKTGWTFVGWNTDKDATTVLSSLTMGINDVELYAIYRKEAVTLTASWNSNGATLSSNDPVSCTIPAVYNKAVQATTCEVTPPTITRTNYDVIGWNTTSTAVTNNASYNTSTNKLTLSASGTWYAITKAQGALTATFSSNNGATVSFSSASCYVYGTSNTCEVDAPTITAQTGFTTVGFHTNQNATANHSSYNTTTGKLTISANSEWFPITRSTSQYTGTFTIQDSNAATKSGGNTSCYRYNGGETCNITAPNLTALPGYTVVGWNKTANSQTAAYASGSTIEIDGNTQFYSITYYNTTVTVTFSKNATNAHVVSQTPKDGSALTDATITQTCNKMNGSTTCNITSPIITASTGYHAIGYNTVANATTSTWNEDVEKAIEYDTTYYAITAGNAYTIRFNANCPSGVTASGSMNDLGMVYGVAKNLTANGFTCPGREFKGWTMSNDGTGTLYQDQESVSNLTTVENATVNLYGKWRLPAPSVTISGGRTKTYGASATTLTCTENTTYPSGVVKYYAFGYSTTANGTPDNWTAASTSNTLSVASSYVGDRYYSCRVYASNGVEESDTVVSSNTTTNTVENAQITFNAGNCGTLTGTNPGYVNSSMTGLYTGRKNETAGTVPTVSKSGYTFQGWYATNSSNNLLNVNVEESLPSNTASANTTARTFTPNTVVKGLAYNNYYAPSRVTSYSASNNSITMVAGSGYGVGFPILADAGKMYSLSYSMTTSTSTGLTSVLFYKQNGDLISTVTSDGNGNKIKSFTTPSETYYMVVVFTVHDSSVTANITNIELVRGLPSGYTQVDYIESTGTQYIDTGYKATPTTGIIMDYKFTDLTVQQRLFGSNTGSTDYLTYQMYINGASQWAYGFVDGSGNWISTSVAADKNRHTVKFNTTSDKIILDNTTLNISSSTRTKTTQTNMYIFARASSDTSTFAKMKLYSFKMYSSNSSGLVRDMIPCIKNSTGEVGMYDIVNNTFYGNAGTGQFIAGVSTKVIESNGTINNSVSGWTDANRKWLLTEDKTLVAKCTPNYNAVFNYQNNIYNQDPLTWTINGNTVIDSAYQYNNTISAAVSSNATLYTGLKIPLNSDKKTNTNYRISIIAKRTGSISGNLRTYGETRDSSNNVISWHHYVNVNDSTTTANTWKELAATFNSGNYSTWEKIQIDYDTANQGPVYVSNIRLDEYTTQTKNYEGTYGNMPTPTRTGYTFGGWYTAASGGTQVTSSTQVSAPGDHTLYAHWTANNYTLTAKPNGGSFNGSTSNTTYTQKFDTQKVLPMPTRTGYTFNGWSKSGSGTVTKLGTPKFSEPTQSMGVYNNSGNGTVTHTSVAKTSDSPISTVSTMVQIKTAGTASPGLGGFHQVTQSRANAVFYHVIVAKIPVGYTIQHAQNQTGDGRLITWLTPQAGTGQFEVYIYRHTCGSSGTFSTFGHVYLSGTAATSSNPVIWYVAYANVFDASAGSPNASSQIFRYGAGATTLTANWTPNVYTITLNQQSGSGGTGTIYEKYATGYYTNSGATTQMTTSANGITVPSRTGYNFGGYYTSTGGGGTQFIGTNGRITSSASTTQFSAAGSLYAKWSPVSYTISSNYNSGGNCGNPTSYTIESNAITLCQPTRTGYTFTGWTGTGLSSATKTVTIPKGSTGNRSYTANWSANSYTLDVNGLINNKSKGSTAYCGTFDVYTGGTLRANDVNDYNASWVTGTSYSISDIKATSGSGCTYNGVSSGSASGTITGSNITVVLSYTFSSKSYGYTGGMQSFVAPIQGTYQLQVWGAQGGTVNGNSGGKGGYSYGNKSLTVHQTIYIAIGGQPGNYNGGYNGGGYANGNINDQNTNSLTCGASCDYSRGGGGATHIGSQNAVLASCSPANVFIVAGGGGGSGEGSAYGGYGGGSSGANGGGNYGGKGASATAGGASGYANSATPGTFGQGGHPSVLEPSNYTRYWAGGGGGGWYGGGGGDWSWESVNAGGGGGGSGYIAGVTGGSTSGNSRTGSGYATISWVS